MYMKKIVAGVCVLLAAVICCGAAFASETPAEDAALLEGVSEYSVTDDGEIKAVVTVKGFHGDVTLNIGVATDKTVSGIEVISHEETPALGGMVLAEENLEKCVGVSSAEEIDAVAGATNTSNALREAVTIAINQFRAACGEEIEQEADGEDEAALLEEALKEQLGDEYEELDCELLDKITAVYHSEKGYGFYTCADGHYEGEPIKLLVVLDPDGVLTEIVVIRQNETDGVGSNVFNQAYLNFYKGGRQFKPFAFGEGQLIDMYSGATETSFSVFSMVDAATKQYALVK